MTNIKYPKLQDVDWLASKVSDTPLRAIADEIGCSYGAVICAVRRHKIKVPHRDSHRYVDKSEAVKRGLREKYPNGRFGSLASNWRGGRRKTNGGYIYIHQPDHPNATKSGCVFEHILIAEKKIGRLLRKGEVVHHINGDKNDNEPNNLLVCTRAQHVQIHMDAVKEVFRLRKILDEHGIVY